MGCCATCTATPDQLINLEVSKEINGDKAASEKIQKLLFLGSGGSGKSTFFKQLKCIHGKGFSEKDRRVFREHISTQIIEQMSRCVECIPYHNERLSELEAEFTPIALSDAGEAAAHYLLEEIPPDHLVNRQVAEMVALLWAEPAIQTIYKNRAHFHIDDSSAYFFQHIERIGACEAYLPTDLDILYVRYRTTGVIEAQFTISGSKFTILDVGGQQSERKKWIHCFENVTAVIFVASLSCYDEVMFEDDQVNCMQDSLQLFKEICALQWFVKTPVILFLNKRDLFEAKIHLIPLSVCFEEFAQAPPNAQNVSVSEQKEQNMENAQNSTQQPMLTQPMLATANTAESEGGSSKEREQSPLLTPQQAEYMKASMDFIRQKFLAMSGRRTRNDAERAVYIHITTATNKDNVTKVFSDVQQIVVSRAMHLQNIL